ECVVALGLAPPIDRLIIVADAADVFQRSLRRRRCDLLPLPVLYGVETSRARSLRVGVRGSLRERAPWRLPLTRRALRADLSPQAGRGGRRRLRQQRQPQ